MKFTSQVVSAASGSVGGQTFSRNRSGQYVRRRSVPVNPNTPNQQAARSAFTSAVVSWNTVSASIREGWKTYADNVSRRDALGQVIYATAQNWYIAVISIRAKYAPSTLNLNTAPTIFDRSNLSPPTITVNANTDEFTINASTSDEWAVTEGGILIIKVSRPQTRTINYFTGPFTTGGAIVRGASAPNMPQTLPLPFPVSTGQRLFFAVSALTADNRLTEEQILRVDT